MTQEQEDGTGAGSAGDPGVGSADLDRRLERLRACVDEVADLVDAGLERLETLEMQLGEPGAGVEAVLASAMERCERLLDGIDHRLHLHGERTSPGEEQSVSAVRVLVVMADSARRAGWCVALERLGIASMAAPDAHLAQRRLAEEAVDAVLLDAASDGGALIQWWLQGNDGMLPPAAVLASAGDHETCALPRIDEQFGPASAAAVLRRLANGRTAAPHSGLTMEENDEHAST
jgi:CheY-like chemotaxis protein